MKIAMVMATPSTQSTYEENVRKAREDRLWNKDVPEAPHKDCSHS